MRNVGDGVDRLSLRAGMVLAVECFERALALFNVDDPALDHLLDVLLQLPAALLDFRWVDTQWAWGRPIPGARTLLKPAG